MKKWNKNSKKLIDEKQIKNNELLRRTIHKSGSHHSKIDQSIKIALDSKIINDATRKNKYQKQSIDHIMDKKSQGKY